MTTYSTASKNTTTYTGLDGSGITYYVTTDTPDYILVGASEDLYLVWQDATSYTGGTKNSASYSTANKASTSFSTTNKTSTSYSTINKN